MYKKSTPLYFLFHYIQKYKFILAIGIIFILITTALQVLNPWLIKYAIDYISHIKTADPKTMLPLMDTFLAHVSMSSPTRILLAYILIIILATILQGVFRFLMRYTIIGVSRKIEYDIRNDYFTHLQRLTQSFYQRNQMGDLMARATNDLNAVRSLFGPGIMYMVTTFFLFVITISFMLSINKTLTLWALLIVPVSIWLVYKLVSKIESLFKVIQEQFSKLTATTEESINGIRVIKSYTREEPFIAKFNKESKDLVDKNLALAKIRAMLRSVIQYTTSIGLLIILWIGGQKIINQTLTIGDLVAFFAYLAMLTWPMIAFGWVLNVWQQGLASVKRIIAIMDEKPEFENNELTNHSIQDIEGKIEFQNVSFSYHADEPEILHNINLTIDKGTTVAIVGATGSGKTSLINLVPRLYDIQKGSIKIDGNELREIPLEVLRKNIGYVPQESFLFSDTIENNLLLGINEPDSKALEHALQVSQLSSDMDQFPEKLDTIVGERGITLSGGQKQRAAIARAIIKQPSILIFDDSLSAVDTYTEEKILSGLRNVMQDCTSIIVSHRISTVKHADKIIVIDDGNIVEEGDHTELLDRKGEYFKLYQRQLLEKSLEEL